VCPLDEIACNFLLCVISTVIIYCNRIVFDRATVDPIYSSIIRFSPSVWWYIKEKSTDWHNNMSANRPITVDFCSKLERETFFNEFDKRWWSVVEEFLEKSSKSVVGGGAEWLTEMGTFSLLGTGTAGNTYYPSSIFSTDPCQLVTKWYINRTPIKVCPLYSKVMWQTYKRLPRRTHSTTVLQPTVISWVYHMNWSYLQVYRRIAKLVTIAERKHPSLSYLYK